MTEDFENFSGKLSMLLAVAGRCFVLLYFGGKFLLWLCIPKSIKP